MLPFFLLFAAEIATTKPEIGPIEKQHRIVVEAVRGCPERDEDDIVVCSRDRGISEGYRLPKLDPRFEMALRANGRGGLTDPDLGASGTGSCSATGAGGATGCSKRAYNAWAQWKQEQKKQARAYEDPN